MYHTNINELSTVADKAMKHSENRFKRFVDSTLTVDVWENLQKCSQSVGCLHSPLQISTVFRVGNASVLSAAHHVLEIIGWWQIQF